MSMEYTSALIKEIDLYIENLHKFQNFDIAPLEEEYNKYIDRVNTIIPDSISNVLKGIRLKQQGYNDFSLLQNEAQKELDVLERQLLVLEDSDAPIKRNINSLKSKIKKAKTELEEKKQLINDPLRRLLGYRAKDSERIAELEATIKTYNDEISTLEFKRDLDEIKNLKSRISSVKSRIENLRNEKRSVIANQDGEIKTPEKELETVAKWLQKEYLRQLRIWLGFEEPDREDLYTPQIINEYKKYFNKVNLLNISGYNLMNYKNLLDIMALYPNNIRHRTWVSNDGGKTYGPKYLIKLPESFSAACQEKFKQLQDNVARNEGDKIYEKKKTSAFMDIIFPSDPREIKCEKFENLIYKETEKGRKIGKKTFNINTEALPLSIAEFIQKNRETTITKIAVFFKVGNGLLLRILNELKENDIIGEFNGTDPNSIITYTGLQINDESPIVEKELIISELIFLDYDFSRKQASEKVFEGVCVNEGFLLQIKEMITKNPEMDLPDIIIALREDEMDYYEIANELLSFRNLYRETPEQILKTNQQFFAEKEIEQLKENARKEREMYERQAELEREAENERARMIANAERERASAERERAAAENRRTETMAYQARLDREAADKRAADERYEAEKRQRQAEADARQKRHEDAQNAIWRCKSCAHFASCRQSKNAPFCASYLPK